jgi:hypothetical protein
VTAGAARPSLIALCGLAATSVALSGCLGVETTPEKSAKRAKLAGRRIAEQKGVVVGRANASIKVEQTALVQDANGVAAVVHLKNTGTTQASLPVGITVADAKGKKLYANDVPGLDPSLTSLPVLGAGKEADWVDNQILIAGKASAIDAKVGAGKGKAPTALPEITLSDIAHGRDADGFYAKGTVRNASPVAQKRLVITCVARDGGKVLAAGRAVIDRLLPAAALKKPTTFTVFFIGDPKRSKLDCSAPPTVLSQGGTQ